MDRLKACAVPILKKFLSGDNEVIFTINKRGAAPLGGGEIKFKCPPSRNLRSIQVSRKYIFFIKVFIIYNLKIKRCICSFKIVEW